MKLEPNDKFTISYKAKTHKGKKLDNPITIFRKGMMTDIAKGEFKTKSGNKCFGYYDLTAQFNENYNPKILNIMKHLLMMVNGDDLYTFKLITQQHILTLSRRSHILELIRKF